MARESKLVGHRLGISITQAVQGHSMDGGNDRADELAWWGKEGPPFG
jgi:hypothetical protein